MIYFNSQRFFKFAQARGQTWGLFVFPFIFSLYSSPLDHSATALPWLLKVILVKTIDHDNMYASPQFSYEWTVDRIFIQHFLFSLWDDWPQWPKGHHFWSPTHHYRCSFQFSSKKDSSGSINRKLLLLDDIKLLKIYWMKVNSFQDYFYVGLSKEVALALLIQQPRVQFSPFTKIFPYFIRS